MRAETRQSVRAVVGVVAVAAILVSLRSIYQEHRRQGEIEQARATVRGQLQAFEDGDYEKAFTFAAGRFHEEMTLQSFQQMVKDGYPQIAHPREFRLGAGRWEDDVVLIDVVVTGENGVTAPHTYALAREADGWKVAGVSGGAPLPPPKQGGKEAPPLPSTPVGSA